MYKYSIIQWISFFIVYCFLGWVWETLFVSIRKKQLVNRGFLNGPFLPIYGFGAIIILFLTLPVQESLILIYLVGMLGATALEYVTGYIVEKLFDMRYWDYRNHRFNIKGYICLKVSLAWGIFSIILVKVIHQPIESFILGIPESTLQIIDVLFVITFVCDVIYSTIQALDLKHIVNQSQELQRLQVLIDDINHRKEEWNSEMARLQKEFQHQKELYERLSKYKHKRALHILKRNPNGISYRHQLPFDDILNNLKQYFK